MKTTISLLLMLFLATNLLSQCFLSANKSKNGVFNIEAESKNAENWTGHETGDFTERVYLEWTGDDHFNDPGTSVLSYPIHITSPGTYTFFWQSKVGIGDDPTKHNDSWLRFPDASKTFAVKESVKDTIRPKGLCQEDCPKGAGSDGWYKMYSSNTTDWTWTSRTSDNDPHEIRVEFNTPGLYHNEISGRSKGHLIDKMILFPHYMTLRDALIR